MYIIEENFKEILTKDLIKNYQRPEEFLPYCESCDSYGLRWSCPPVKLDPKAYLAQYNKMIFIGFKVIYQEDFLKELTDKAKAEYYSTRLLKKLRKAIAQELLNIEELMPQSRSFGAGSCLWCCKCTRQLPEPLPCKKPEKMRYSLDTFGLDLTNLSQELLNTPILWQGEPLPKYHHLIFALGVKDNITPEVLEAMKNIVLPNLKFEDLEVKHKKG